MLEFNYLTDFSLEDEPKFIQWIQKIIQSEQKSVGDISYIFCSDDYLYDINVKYLNHNTLTDIISFDYTEDAIISGDIFISIDRVRENAVKFEVPFQTELLRVMAHGVLHYCGYKDKSEEDSKLMRAKEQEKMNMFHMEQL